MTQVSFVFHWLDNQITITGILRKNKTIKSRFRTTFMNDVEEIGKRQREGGKQLLKTSRKFFKFKFYEWNWWKYLEMRYKRMPDI